RIWGIDAFCGEECHVLYLLAHQPAQRVGPPYGSEVACGHLRIGVGVHLGQGNRQIAPEVLSNQLAQPWQKAIPFAGTVEQLRRRMASIVELVAMKRDSVDQMEGERGMLTLILTDLLQKLLHPQFARGVLRASAHAIKLADFWTKHLNMRIVLMHGDRKLDEC